MELEQELALLAMSFKLVVSRIQALNLNRELCMVVTLRQLISVYQNNQYHWSSVLKGLSDLALEETVGETPELIPTWQRVSTLLQTAAQEAETQGRELP